MFKEGKLTSEPAEIPDRLELLTLRHSTEGQSFLVSSNCFAINEEDRIGYLNTRAELDGDIIQADGVYGNNLRVVHMPQGFVIDLFGDSDNVRSDQRFESLFHDAILLAENTSPVVGYVTNQKELDELRELYRQTFGSELVYSFAPEEPESDATGQAIVTEIYDWQRETSDIELHQN